MTRKIKIGAQAILAWICIPAILVLGVPLAVEEWGGERAYQAYLVFLSVFGLACSLFVVLTWTPYIIRAARRGPLRVSGLAIADFATLAYLGTFVFGLRLFLTAFATVPAPPSAGFAVMTLAVWTLVAIKVGLRAWIWGRAMRRGPGALDDVSAHVRAPLHVLDEEPDAEA